MEFGFNKARQTLLKTSNAPSQHNTVLKLIPVVYNITVVKKTAASKIFLGRFFGRPFVKRFALCYRSVVCPVLSACPVLSVTFVHCGQTVGRIKMKLGVQVGLGAGHIVLHGDRAPPPLKGHSPLPSFRPISVAAKWLHGSRCHLVWRWASAHSDLC